MGITGALFLLLTAAASAQVQGTRPAAQPLSAQHPPTPEPDGSYGYRQDGITPPRVVRAVAAHPKKWPKGSADDVCSFDVLIGRDGTLASIFSAECTFGEADLMAATEAIRKTTYEPGYRDQTAVPVRLPLEVRFDVAHDPALPSLPENALGSGGDPRIIPPVLIRSAIPKYSREARRKKTEGVVIVSLTVTADGVPSDVHVVKSLGYGLDEEALKAVSKYRFRPATLEARAMATSVNIEIAFHIY